MVKLRRSQAYTPGQPLFTASRGFLHPKNIAEPVLKEAYEMISGEPVTVSEFDDERNTILGTFVDHTGTRVSAEWTSTGTSRGTRTAEFTRPLQLREDFFQRYRTFVEGLENEMR